MMMANSTFRFHKFEDDMPLAQSIMISPQMPMYHSVNTFSNHMNKKLTTQTAFNPLRTQTNRSVDSTPFPFNEIISLDFVRILSRGDLGVIEGFLPKMLNQKFKSNTNSSLVNLINAFQNVLIYLFQLQEGVNMKNEELEEGINSQTSFVNQQRAMKEATIQDNNRMIKLNSIRQQELKRKIAMHKAILYTKGYQKLIPNPGPLKIKEGRFFYCDLCPYKKFSSYEIVHAHYIKRHFKGSQNPFGQSNENFQKMYFDSKLDMMKDELKQTFMSFSRVRDDEHAFYQDTLKRSLLDMNNKKDSERRIRPLVQTEDKSSVIINHYDRSGSIRTNKRESSVGPSHNFVSRNVKEMMNQLQSKHDENIKGLKSELNKFKEEIMKQLANMSRQPRTVDDGHYDREIKEQQQPKERVILKTTYINQRLTPGQSPSSEPKRQVEVNPHKNLSPILSPKSSAHNIKSPSPKEELSAIEHNQTFGSQDIINPEELLKQFYKKYTAREHDVLFNSKFKSCNEIAKQYNFYKLNPTTKGKQSIIKSIEDHCGKYGLSNEINRLLPNQEAYAKTLEDIFKRNIANCEKNDCLAKYKDNAYWINNIEGSLKDINTPFTDKLYNQVNIDQIFNYVEYTKKAKELK